MRPIVAPITPDSAKPEIANLQQALGTLLGQGAIRVADDEREALLDRLREDRVASAYRNATKALVRAVQERNGADATGLVDERTADLLNGLLREHGLLDEEPGGGQEPPPRNEQQAIPARFAILCRVLDARDEPIAGLRVEAFDAPADLPRIPIGPPALTDADGTARFLFVRADAARDTASGPDLAFAVYRDEVLLAHSMPDVNDGAGVLRRFRPRRDPITLRVERHHVVTGTLVHTQGLPATKVKVFAAHIGFGDETRALAETGTDDEGRYELAYDPGTTPVNLQLSVADLQDGARTLPLMKPRLAAAAHEVLNLVAPATAMKSEYDRLRDDLVPHLGSIERLKEVRETAERPELSMLNRATGWDARLIALASVAEHLAASDQVGLPKAAMYGMLRAGLPSDRRLLAQVDPATAMEALKASRDAGVVEMTDAQLEEARDAFTKFANAQRLAAAIPGSASTYSALIRSSGLQAESRAKFESVFLGHRGDGAKLWEAARAAGLKPVEIGTLQLQGKLAFLTGNHAGLTARLMKKVREPAALVGLDFDRAGTWVEEIYREANIPAERRAAPTEEDRRALDALVPPTYAGAKAEDRVAAYAQDMARKLRLSYPTQVIARMIERNEIGLTGAPQPATAKVLKLAAARGFRLGETPVETFLQTHAGIANALTDAEKSSFPAIRQELKKLHRLYQTTASNEAIPVLLAMGITSAYDVTGLEPADFVSRFNQKYFEIHGKSPPGSEAQKTLDRSRQVSSVIYNLFTVARKLEAELPVRGMAAPPKVRERVRNDLVKQFPTMASLFGSMDYCECDQCRSVLSPAAYFVDLLQSLEEWGARRKWPATSPSGRPYLAPYDALIARRPDLPFIALTCENTHTAMPYIDLVNEILEYYVAFGELSGDAARDTADATTPELLAEPQNLIREAYEILRSARYPLTLPFDLWIETVRRFCDSFEVPLHRLLEVFRTNERLFAPTQDVDRARICAESLGIAPGEVALFTDAKSFPAWSTLYGYGIRQVPVHDPGTEVRGSAELATLSLADEDARHFSPGDPCHCIEAATSTSRGETKAILEIGAPGSAGAGRTKIVFEGTWTHPPVAGDLLAFDAPAVLQSAKALSQRLGVTYKQIVELVETAFVNPRIGDLGVLQKLGVSIATARFYQERHAFFAANEDLVDKQRSELSPEQQARFDELSTPDPDTQRSGFQDLLEIRAIKERLAERAKAFGVKPDELEAEVLAIPFGKVLVLADQDASCNFDRTLLRHADGTPADDFVFLRINLLVRLWHKLGWTIGETGQALAALIPADVRAGQDAGALARWLQTALIYLAHLKSLEEKLKLGKNRAGLLAFWTNIGTEGESSLYSQLFLGRSVLRNDIAFDHPYGRYLDASWLEALAQAREHEVSREGVDAASKIDAGPFGGNTKIRLHHDDLREVQTLRYEGILSDAEKASLQALLPESRLLAELLEAVQAKATDFSLVRGHLPALQGALGLTFDELRLVLERNGLSLGSASLSIGNVSLLHRHRVLASALRLSVAELVALIELSGCDPFTALHGAPLETLEQDHPFTKTLRFVQIVEEVRESGLTIAELDYVLRHRYDEVGKYGPNEAASLLFLKTLGDSIRSIRDEHAVPDGSNPPGEELLRQKLGLSFTPEIVERFLSMLRGTGGDESAVRADFEKYFMERESPLGEGAGFLKEADFGDLFTPIADEVPVPAGEDLEAIHDARDRNERARQLKLQERRLRVARAYLPFLQRRLVRQMAIQTMQSNSGADPELIECLLTDKRVLGSTAPLLDVLAAAGETGISTTFFPNEGLTGTPLAVAAVNDADTGLKVKQGDELQAIKPGNAKSALFEGYLTVPASGAYRFFIELDEAGAEALLRFPHLPEPRWLGGVAAAAGTVLGDDATRFVELKAGTPYRFELRIAKLKGGDVRLRVQGDAVPKGTLAGLGLHPSDAILRAAAAMERLGKVLRIVQGLGLTAREVRHLQTHSPDFGGIDFNTLPTALDDSADAASRATERFTQFLRVAAYARLKRELAGDRDDLIDVFERDEMLPGANRREGVYERLATLSRRDVGTVRATAKALFRHDASFLSAGRFFTNEQPLARLWEALQVVERFGVPVETLLDWTRIVATADGGEQRGFTIARDLRAALKARFTQDAWQNLAQPIFDRLRQRQRDALVAYVMHRKKLERPEQLFEYFLVDPGTEPVVQTSRIRLAISSVQVFIQQCLMNLAPEVHPAAISASEYEYKKRYTLWEADRRIFLFPENWLEPEFRDDKTHLFRELEGTLLQGDVSNDLVEDAFLTYLRKLDQLARLDIVAMHIQDDPDAARRVLHVFGRTFTQPYKYFYRRYAKQMWTPWEPVNAEIEGDHLAPVVWRDRLYLFWVTFLTRPEPPSRHDLDVTSRYELQNVDLVYNALDKATAGLSVPEQVNPKQFSSAASKSSGPSLPREEDQLANLTVGKLMDSSRQSAGLLTVEAQLHWSEYVGGEWSARESGGFDAPEPIAIYGQSSFDARSVFVHVSHEAPGEDGEERGVFIHLGKPFSSAFYLAGRNSAPRRRNNPDALRGRPIENPYSSHASTVDRNRYRGSGALSVHFHRHLTTDPATAVPAETQEILAQSGQYTIVLCNNHLGQREVKESDPAIQGATDPDAVRAAIQGGLAEVGSLVKPFFYQDEARRQTLFVEPNLIERTTENWRDWVPPPPAAPSPPVDLKVWPIKPCIPKYVVPKYRQVFDPPRIDPDAILEMAQPQDWLVNEVTAVAFHDKVIGPQGWTGIEIQKVSPPGGTGFVADVASSPGLVPGTAFIVADPGVGASGLAQAKQGLHVVGKAGVSPEQVRRVSELSNVMRFTGIDR